MQEIYSEHLKKIIRSATGKRKIKSLLDTLEKYHSSLAGPYAATHGEKHIARVIANLVELITPMAPNHFEENELLIIFSAALIHDVGMIRMIPSGAEGEEADKLRKDHAKRENIERIANEFLVQYDESEREKILDIASAHADDSKCTNKDKYAAFKNRWARTESNNYLVGIILLQAADFFDIGIDRLAPGYAKIAWPQNQIQHLKIHKYIKARISSQHKIISLSPDIPNSEDPEATGNMALYRSIFEQASTMILLLNEALKNLKIEWSLEPLDESLFGKVYPLSSSINLFSMEFKKSKEDYKNQAQTKDIFKIDLMGHSLYQRFVSDSEKLNKELLSFIKEKQVKVRILLLDPSIENQQSYEVFEAQIDEEKGSNRSILPKYQNEFTQGKAKLDGGDIWNSLKKITTDWANVITGNSSIEVRVTKRIMYNSSIRFNSRMICTPYRHRGLFNNSLAILFTDKAPLFKAYKDEFNSIWKSKEETRLYYINGSKTALEKYFSDKFKNVENKDSLNPMFDYNTFLINNHLNRVKRWFSHKPTAPYEIEIQPSSICSLNCSHCVGNSFSSKRKKNKQYVSIEKFKKVFNYKDEDSNEIKRYRISGLVGDPLTGEGRNLTMQLIQELRKRKKEIVIITNGVGLNSPDVLDKLILADYVHISLDAATEKVFSKLKGVKKRFDKIVDNVKHLERKRTETKSKLKIGIGFIVTQLNYHQVEDIIELAENIRADFVRFKPDIRVPSGISWRSWRETQAIIKNKREEYWKNKKLPEIVLTDVPWHQYKAPMDSECWAQYLNTTIGPDGSIYYCDHLSNSGRSIGNICGSESFAKIWNKNYEKLGRSCSDCGICPPYNFAINNTLSELYSIYKTYGWSPIAKLGREFSKQS